MWVPVPVKKSVCTGLKASAVGTEESGDEAADMEDPSATPLFPYGKCEMLAREMIHMFSPSSVVTFAATNGEDVLACVRAKIQVAAFVLNRTHAMLIRDRIVVTALLEHIDAVDDGFLERRFLKKQDSLGGQSGSVLDGTAPSAAQSSAPEAPSPQQSTHIAADSSEGEDFDGEPAA